MHYTHEQKTTKSNDWEKLNAHQQQDTDALRNRMNAHLIAETEEFYKHHPELKLMWDFTLDVLIREQHDILPKGTELTPGRKLAMDLPIIIQRD